MAHVWVGLIAHVCLGLIAHVWSGFIDQSDFGFLLIALKFNCTSSPLLAYFHFIYLIRNRTDLMRDDEILRISHCFLDTCIIFLLSFHDTVINFANLIMTVDGTKCANAANSFCILFCCHNYIISRLIFVLFISNCFCSIQTESQVHYCQIEESVSHPYMLHASYKT